MLISTLPINAVGGWKAKGCIAEAVSSARTGGAGWDIAEYVMYCHLCGALSETYNTSMWL